MPEGMGTAKYGKSDYAKRFKIVTDKNGATTHNVYRIIPPIKSLAQSGKFRAYHGTHFGYKTRASNDATKTQFATFECVEEKDFKTGIVRIRCAECDKIAADKKIIDSKREKYTAEGMLKDDIKILLAPFQSWTDSHNRDGKYHLNVMNEAGEFGTLPIGSKMNKSLDIKIAELMAEKIDPISPLQGVWFDFKRTGNGRDIVDVVEVVKVVTVEGNRRFEEIKSAPLTDEQCAEAVRLCEDLPFIVTKITPEQVQQLVDCSGDPDEVAAIFGSSAKREDAPVAKKEAAVSTTTLKAKVEVAPKRVEKAATPPAVVEDDEDAELERQIAARKAARAAAKTAAEKSVTPTIEPEITDFTGVSDADFMKQFEP